MVYAHGQFDLLVIRIASLRKAEFPIERERRAVFPVAGQHDPVGIPEGLLRDVFQTALQRGRPISQPLPVLVDHHVPDVILGQIIVIDDHHIADHLLVTEDPEGRALVIIHVGLRKAPDRMLHESLLSLPQLQPECEEKIGFIDLF